MKSANIFKKIVLKNKILILVAGFPGSGKTYLSHRLIKRIHAVYIDKDEINDVFTLRRTDPIHKKFKDYAYKIMYALTSVNLKLNNSVVLDAPFTQKQLGNREWVKFIKGFAKKHDTKIKVLWCEAPNHIRKGRIIKRNHERDKERYEKLDEFINRAEKLSIPIDYMVVETSRINWTNIFNFIKN
jgi:predicted kinase